MPSNPPFPFGAGGPEDGLGALDPPLPLGHDSPLPAPVAPPPASLVPESVRSRAASDLPFDLGGGGSPFASAGPSGGSRFDTDTEGIPTGLPDLGVLLGVAPALAPEVSGPLPGRAPHPLPDDDDMMALPSPSMIEPSPFVPQAPPLDRPEAVEAGEVSELDDAGFHDLLPALDSPVAPKGAPSAPRSAAVPAEVLFRALREVEDRSTRRMVLAFLLGSLATSAGFLGAWWATVAFG